MKKQINAILVSFLARAGEMEMCKCAIIQYPVSIIQYAVCNIQRWRKDIGCWLLDIGYLHIEQKIFAH